MTPERLLKMAIEPALEELEELGVKATPEAKRFMLAIAIQESGLRHRRQTVGATGEEAGPASSFWQAEVMGGCKGVLTHPVTEVRMVKLCDAFNVKAEPWALWEAIRYQDVLAAVMARLLILTLPYALPKAMAEGWKQYTEAWRPGKPRLADWAESWTTATVTVFGGSDGT